MIGFSHRFTFGLCLSVIVLTASVIAAATLALQQHRDNSLLHRHISSLKAENAALREQLRRVLPAATDRPRNGPELPAAADRAVDGSERASDS